MTRTAPTALVLACVLLFAAGCQQQRLSVEKSVTMQPGDILQPAIVDAPKAEQRIKVELTASEPVDLDVALESKASDIMTALRAGKRPEAGAVLASKQKAKEATLDATVPAGQSFTVILSGANKKTDVKVKVNSQ